MKLLRINLMVCERGNAELSTWVQRDIGILMRRNEITINAAYIKSTGTLLFPAFFDESYLHSLRRYKLAAEFLCGWLSDTKPRALFHT